MYNSVGSAEHATNKLRIVDSSISHCGTARARTGNIRYPWDLVRADCLRHLYEPHGCHELPPHALLPGCCLLNLGIITLLMRHCELNTTKYESTSFDLEKPQQKQLRWRTRCPWGRYAGPCVCVSLSDCVHIGSRCSVYGSVEVDGRYGACCSCDHRAAEDRFQRQVAELRGCRAGARRV